MSDPFALIVKGQSLDSGVGPFNADWHNAVTESVRERIRKGVGEPTSNAIEIEFDPWIWLANISGEPIPQYTAVGLGSLSILPGDNTDFKRRLSFLSADLADDEPFGIVQDPIEANARFVAKASVSAGELQPPNPEKWIRLLGEPESHDSGTRYVIGQQVTVSSVTYACIKPHYNVTPPDTDYWIVVGADVGIWKVDDSYSSGDVANLPTVGRIIVHGATRAWVNVLDAGHQYAGIVGGELKSMADPGPLTFLWKEGGTGEQWAVVRFDESCCGECTTPASIGGQAAVWGVKTGPSTLTSDGDGPGLANIGTFTWEWTVPDCVTEVLVECFGRGAESAGSLFIAIEGGGGGGGYSASTLTVTPGDVYTVDTENELTSGIYGAAFLDTDGTTVLVSAENGGAPSGGTGGIGAPTTNATGDVKYAGGDGGDLDGIAVPYVAYAGGGGGGGAGPNGDGEDGEDGVLGPDDGAAGPVAAGGAGYSSGGQGGQFPTYSSIYIPPGQPSFPGGGGGGANWDPLPVGSRFGLVRITWGVVAPRPVESVLPTGDDSITVTTTDGEIDGVKLIKVDGGTF